MEKRYVFFASNEEYFNVAYSEIRDLPNVHYQTGYLYTPGNIRKALHSLHNFKGLAKKIDLPMRSIWYKQYFSEKYDSKKQYFFIFFSNWSRICGDGFVQYLRKEYPGCKCILFLQDVNNAKKLDMRLMKRTFDHVMIFERNYAKECGIEYYPLVYCEGLKEIPLTLNRSIDLLFVGCAKGRYATLKKIYDRLSKNGINCQFYLSRMDQDVNTQDRGIHVIDYLDYEDTIRLLKKSKCVLDIIPDGTDCNTLRLCEAMCYNNRLLTNNAKIVNEEFFNPDLISVYSDADDIDVDFLKKEYLKVDYHYKEQISPVAFLKHLDSVFK